jgi:UTP--glucose-1-phosphate uridylyltransferase
MEVSDRTEADKKGGHLAQMPGGQFILRESAQCPAEDMPTFQDISRHKYFNTNNLWIRLPTLQRLLASKADVLGLAMIRNSKTLDPRDKTSPPVYQLETAMGSAIAVFQGAQAVRVPRNRFAPIKRTSDLLDIRSDTYILDDTYRIVPNPKRRLGRIVINLDPAYYQLIDDFAARFPQGAPSLLECERLTVKGDIRFGRGVTLKGAVELVNSTARQVTIEDGAVISGRWEAD